MDFVPVDVNLLMFMSIDMVSQNVQKLPNHSVSLAELPVINSYYFQSNITLVPRTRIPKGSAKSNVWSMIKGNLQSCIVCGKPETETQGGSILVR